jgi:hypothetical protein
VGQDVAVLCLDSDQQYNASIEEQGDEPGEEPDDIFGNEDES